MAHFISYIYALPFHTRVKGRGIQNGCDESERPEVDGEQARAIQARACFLP